MNLVVPSSQVTGELVSRGSLLKDKMAIFFSLLNYDKINTIHLYFVKELWLMNKACRSLMQPRCIVSYVISSTLSTIDEISLMAFAFHLPRT